MNDYLIMLDEYEYELSMTNSKEYLALIVGWEDTCTFNMQDFGVTLCYGTHVIILDFT